MTTNNVGPIAGQAMVNGKSLKQTPITELSNIIKEARSFLSEVTVAYLQLTSNLTDSEFIKEITSRAIEFKDASVKFKEAIDLADVELGKLKKNKKNSEETVLISAISISSQIYQEIENFQVAADQCQKAITTLLNKPEQEKQDGGK